MVEGVEDAPQKSAELSASKVADVTADQWSLVSLARAKIHRGNT